MAARRQRQHRPAPDIFRQGRQGLHVRGHGHDLEIRAAETRFNTVRDQRFAFDHIAAAGQGIGGRIIARGVDGEGHIEGTLVLGGTWRLMRHRHAFQRFDKGFIGLRRDVRRPGHHGGRRVKARRGLSRFREHIARNIGPHAARWAGHRSFGGRLHHHVFARQGLKLGELFFRCGRHGGLFKGLLGGHFLRGCRFDHLVARRIGVEHDRPGIACSHKAAEKKDNGQQSQHGGTHSVSFSPQRG